MLYFYRNRKTYTGFKQWTFAYLLNFCGFVLLSLRNILPDFITIILANSLIVLCFVLIARGMIYFTEGEQNIWVDIAPPSVLIIIFIYFVYFSPDVNARIIVISLIIMFLCLRCVSITLRKITIILGGKNWLLLATFMFWTLWLLLRTALTISIEANIQNFMPAGAIQGITFAASSIGHIFIVFGLLIINAQRLEQNLNKANEEIHTLRGILPICSYCKKIRDGNGYWNQIDAYIEEHSEAEFSHSICKECAEKYFPDMDLYGDDQDQE
jgi:hypothetical protein